jgi:benzylsuccinate CoA-transferase BbsE subunit
MVVMVADAIDESKSKGLLSGIRVLDCGGPEGLYGGRLLADLGADVIRVVFRCDPMEGAPGPILAGPNGGSELSAFEMFVDINKRLTLVDLENESDRLLFAILLENSDVVLTDGQIDGVIIPEHVACIETTVFGRVGSGRPLVGSDLVGLAAGGLLSLGGYPDTAPVAVYGNQALLCGGIMTSVAALLALLSLESTGCASLIEVSVQATVVGALEDATAEYELQGIVRKRAGDQPREAGTGIFRSFDGYIAMVAGKLGTAQAWSNLVRWLQENNVIGSDVLAEDQWTSLEYRREPSAIALFTAIFESFTRTQPSEGLFREGQRRSIAVAPVSQMSDVLADPQLNSRSFFEVVHSSELNCDVTVPGRPYRLYDLPTVSDCDFAREVDLNEIVDDWSNGLGVDSSVLGDNVGARDG